MLELAVTYCLMLLIKPALFDWKLRHFSEACPVAIRFCEIKYPSTFVNSRIVIDHFNFLFVNFEDS